MNYNPLNLDYNIIAGILMFCQTMAAFTAFEMSSRKNPTWRNLPAFFRWPLGLAAVVSTFRTYDIFDPGLDLFGLGDNITIGTVIFIGLWATVWVSFAIAMNKTRVPGAERKRVTMFEEIVRTRPGLAAAILPMDHT